MAHTRRLKAGQTVLLGGPDPSVSGRVGIYLGTADETAIAEGYDLVHLTARSEQYDLPEEGAPEKIHLLQEDDEISSDGRLMLVDKSEILRPMAPEGQPQVAGTELPPLT